MFATSKPLFDLNCYNPYFRRASIGYGGTEKVLVAGAVHSCKVLCRKAKPGCKFD